MTRKFDGDTLVVASHNKGKVREIAALLGPELQLSARRRSLTCPSRKPAIPSSPMPN